MAKSNKQPVTPNFRDMDKEATARAQAALAGGKQEPLTVPKNARVSTDKNGVEYSRWTEQVNVTQAYRTVTKKGLMDVAAVCKIRQSPTKDNTGRRVFAHFYINNGEEIPEGHELMNDRSHGGIITLLQATGFMPEGGALRGSLLDKMFPSKGQPGTSSPLADKTVTANIVQTLAPQKNQKTGKPVLDEDDEPILERRDQIESFLIEVAASDDDEDEDEDEDSDDEQEESDEEEEEEEEQDEEEESDDEDEEESDEDEDEDEEEEEEEPAPVKKKKLKVAPKKVVKKSAKLKRRR